MKSAYISIIGRPSAGKSTLINSICGEKVSIVSPVPQTTRNKIRGIITREEGQLVFIDTPGYHISDKKFNNYLKDLAGSALEDADLFLYVIDTARKPGAEEKEVLSMLEPYFSRTIVALNKTDLPESKPQEIVDFIGETAGSHPAGMIGISAEKGTNVEDILKALYELAPEGFALYPEDYYTDQEPSFRIMEVIREKAITGSRQELPHSIYVEIADMEADRDEEGEVKKLWVRAFLTAERDSQKGILVGRGGENIKRIRLEAQKELNQLFPYRVSLDLRVKVNPKWRRNDGLLKNMLF